MICFRKAALKLFFPPPFHVQKVKLIYINKTCTVCSNTITHKTSFVRKAAKCISAGS